MSGGMARAMCNKPEKSALLPKAHEHRRRTASHKVNGDRGSAVEEQDNFPFFQILCRRRCIRTYCAPASLGLPATLARPDLYENHTCELHVFGGEWSLLDRIRPIQHMQVHRSTNHGATEATQRIRPEREILCVQPKHYGKRKALT